MTRVTVVGAGFGGMTCAQRLAEKELAEEVVLIDIIEGRPQGLALPLNQAAAIEGYQCRLVGPTDPQDTHGAHPVHMTAGLPPKPGLPRRAPLPVHGKPRTPRAGLPRAADLPRCVAGRRIC